jgi:hypothetical protein
MGSTATRRLSTSSRQSCCGRPALASPRRKPGVIHILGGKTEGGPLVQPQRRCLGRRLCGDRPRVQAEEPCRPRQRHPA